MSQPGSDPPGSSQITGSGPTQNTRQAEVVPSASLQNTPQQGPAFVKPGEELSPNSDIWRQYAQEAKEYDDDLALGRDKNLDTMLLFAGLFSAILTAFLIESTDMLEPDLAETSTALLLSIAQSQWRIETGNQNKSAPMVEIPPFETTGPARWINTLWFMALALSLGAAMMAMLAKEWLIAFRTSPSRHPLDYSLKRQARLDAFESWHAIQIIDILPTMLHFSLVLFSLGLIIKLWLLDPVIATIVGAVSATLTLLYVTVVLLGAINENCPYRTRSSEYIRILLDWFRILRVIINLLDWFKSFRHAGETTTEFGPVKANIADKFRALQWLAKNARDPNVGNSVWQALAKTRQWQSERESSREQQVLGQHISNQLKVMKMGAQDLHHLRGSLKKYFHELDFCGSLGAAATLPEIYYYVDHCLQHQIHDGVSKKLTSLHSDLQGYADKFKKAAFRTLDYIWKKDDPLTADTHALLTASELRFTKFHVVKIIREEMTHQTPRSHAVIQVSTQDEATLEELGDRCNSALSRAATQLLSHANGREPISTALLINLLEAMHEVARAGELQVDPQTTSTTPSTQENGNTINSNPTTASSTAIKYLIPVPKNIGDASGLLASLTALMGSASVTDSPKLEVAVFNAIVAFGPKLMKQWLRNQLPSLEGQRREEAEVYIGYLGWLPTFADPAQTISQTRAASLSGTKSAIACLLEITHFAIVFIDNPSVRELSELALESLYNRASASSLRHIAHEAIRPRIGMLQFWVSSIGSVELEDRREKSWRQRAKMHLVRLLAIQDEKGESILHHLLRHMEDDDDCYQKLSTVLELMGTASGYPEEIQELLETILSRIRDARDGYYLKSFSADRGFCYLRDIGSNSNFAALVARNIRNLVTYLANWKADNGTVVQIESDAILGFLEAITFVCEHMPPQWDKSVDSFATSAITLLKRSELRLYLSNRAVLHDLKAISTQMKNEAAKDRFLAIHTELHEKTWEARRVVETICKGILELKGKDARRFISDVAELQES